MLDEKDIKYLQDMESRLSAKIDQTREDAIANMRVILESYVEPKFNLLAEGHRDIFEAMTPKSEVEELRGEMDLLKMVIRTLSQDVAELKKAQ